MQNPEICREIVRQLWPFLDGALPDDLQARVSDHLAGCVNCRSHYDFERAFLEAVRASSNFGDEFEPLRARVLAALAAEGMSIP
ncbi:MAG: putative zinc-finger [Gemmatimonadetes bacterium]|nr:putative zinc-finger [Gemmatimonadota bacterium]